MEPAVTVLDDGGLKLRSPIAWPWQNRALCPAVLHGCGRPLRSHPMRDREIIDSELRLLAAVRRTIRDEGGPMPTTAPMDELLDERLAHRGRPGEDAVVHT